jgi:hypothetical protein
MSNFTVEIKGEFTKIFCNFILHLCFKHRELLSVHAWIESTDWYCIELYLTNDKILLEYDDRNKWINILELFDKNVIK